MTRIHKMSELEQLKKRIDEDYNTYYQKWNDNQNQFSVFEWRMGGLTGLDLKIIDATQYEASN
jgi:hypothetical protein